ncbi:FAD-dependent oxidoreductase [Candidatus Scalindua japonica]|nr:FAD-dependent oxidoreductase [Candidatus Scalindua japonica]
MIKEKGGVKRKPRVIILGAGPAGLYAAFQLIQKGLAAVTVLEQSETVGGTAASFKIYGVRVDYGSHRLHPACKPDILEDIRILLDKDLLDRPRHGRIRLHGQWVHFPLKPLDLMLRLSPGFAFNAATDVFRKVFKNRSTTAENKTFASVLEQGLGRTICRDFYFPYARKLWGMSPDEVSPIQAKRRVSSNSPGKMAGKILSALPGVKKILNGGRFFYPKYGFGQISEYLFQASSDNGASFCMGTKASSINLNSSGVYSVTCEKDGQTHSYKADYVWSTIPICTLIQCLLPQPPQPIIQASNFLKYRSMIFIYLVLEQKQFSEYDAHYFPESEIQITRLSEPKNYNCAEKPDNITVLCAELPCFISSPEWEMNDKELGELVCRCLEFAEIPVKASVKDVVTRRTKFAYPMYRQGYEACFEQVDQWLSQVENLLTFGRQGLFAHDNTHHAFHMAYSAVDCFEDNGVFDNNKWKKYRKEFEKHVVED